MKRLLAVALLFTPMLTSADTENPQKPLAWKLAELEENRPLEANSIEVERAKNALNIARSVCMEKTDDELANAAWAVTKFMRKEGIYARPIDILEGLKAVFAGAIKKEDCKKFMTQYATSRHGTGQSHSEAVAAFRTIMQVGGEIGSGQ